MGVTFQLPDAVLRGGAAGHIPGSSGKLHITGRNSVALPAASVSPQAARALLQSSTLHGSVAGRSAPPTTSRGGAAGGSASPAPWERGSGGQGVSRFASRAAGAGADSSAPGSSQGPRVQLHHSATQGHGGSGSAGGVGIGIGAGGSGGPSRFARGAAGGSVGGGAGGTGTTEAGGQGAEEGQTVMLQAPPIMRRGGSGQQATPVTASGA